MAWLEMHMESQALGMGTTLNVLVPQYSENNYRGTDSKENFKVIYLLHGYVEDGSMWLRMTAIERLLRTKPVVVVMPDCYNYWWSNSITGYRFYDYLTEELPSFIGNYFRISVKKEDTMIAGFSMGGWGALHTGWSRPDLYGHVAAFAPAVDLESRYEASTIDRPIKMEWIFGPKEEYLKSDNNLYNLLKKRIEENNLQPTYITVGKDDGLRPDSEKLVKKAEELGQKIDFELVEGIHDWWFAEDAFYRAFDRFMKGGE
ncbi:MAG: hypothetical protein IJM50_07400 [Lachnospiraceae bacterium]|nr:hypothetical protein [Lachnospiraceae bacterium]